MARTAVFPFGSLLPVTIALHGEDSAPERADAGEVLQTPAALALRSDACRLRADAGGADDDAGNLAYGSGTDNGVGISLNTP